MANRVRIATLVPRPPQLPNEMGWPEVVDYMKAHWQRELEQVLPDEPDLIVVPEVCDFPIGWSSEKQTEYSRSGQSLLEDLFTQTASANECNVVYSSVRQASDGLWHNSSVIIDAGGEIAGVYHKNHLVVEENTERGLLYGTEAPIIECSFGRVACAICFDLNFNELRLQYVRAKPDLIVFSSVWHAGNVLQSYWAYSCRCHFVSAVAGVPSQIRNPYGQVIASSTDHRDYVVATVNLDCCLAHYDYNWEKLDALKAKYGPDVDVHDPSQWGSVLISSNTDAATAVEMAKEFEIELLDDYFERALKHRRSQIDQ